MTVYIIFQVYNIALDEEFSLSNILLRMRDGLGETEVTSNYSYSITYEFGLWSSFSGSEFTFFISFHFTSHTKKMDLLLNLLY